MILYVNINKIRKYSSEFGDNFNMEGFWVLSVHCLLLTMFTLLIWTALGLELKNRHEYFIIYFIFNLILNNFNMEGFYPKMDTGHFWTRFNLHGWHNAGQWILNFVLWCVSLTASQLDGSTLYSLAATVTPPTEDVFFIMASQWVW